MKRLFGQNVFDKTKDEYLQELARLAQDPRTLVFIDTNIVSYMYKLHAAARREFFAWTDGLTTANRLAIPSWCANEYLARLRNDELHTYLPKSREPDQPRKALETMLDTASLFVDEQLLRSIEFTGDRSEFLSQFKAAIESLKPFTRAFQHQFDPGAVHAEIVAHLGPSVIDSDVTTLCDRASREGPARVAHRIPPAFRDDEKPENKLGDLIIWFEILEWAKAKAGGLSQVLLVTNDQKSDWVYAPPKRVEVIRGVRRSVSNNQPRIKVIDPRLVAEFERTVGHDNITICSLAVLVEGISRVTPIQVAQLAAAIQINLASQAAETPGASSDATSPSDGESASEAAVLAEDSGSTSSLDGTDVRQPSDGNVESAAPAVAPAVEAGSAGGESTNANATIPEAPAVGSQQGGSEGDLSFDEDAYRDEAYETDAPSEINEVIRALKSHNWYVQNPAIEALKALRTASFSATSWFVLGRNIYQAACGNAQKAMNFMVNLDIQLGRFSDDAAQALLAGMAFEVYFNGKGELRRTGKSGYLDKVLSVLAADQYSVVRGFIQGKLNAAGAQLQYSPGDKREVTLVIRSGDATNTAEEGSGRSSEMEKVRVLESVVLDGTELVVDAGPIEQSPWGGLLYTMDEIVSEVSTNLLIPRWALKRTFEPAVRPDVRFSLPEGRQLRVKSALEPST